MKMIKFPLWEYKACSSYSSRLNRFNPTNTVRCGTVVSRDTLTCPVCGGSEFVNDLFEEDGIIKSHSIS
jgi:hypothetical protein